MNLAQLYQEIRQSYAGQAEAAAAYRSNQREAEESRDERIALFTERVEMCEEQFEDCRLRGGTLCSHTASRAKRKSSASEVQLHRVRQLKSMSIADMSVGKVHKQHVLYCRTVTRCMYFQSVAVLVEDGHGDLVNLQVYNAPRVKTIWDAQAWLPEGTSLAIVEPFFKLRADGTKGIRVDHPAELVRNVEPPEVADAKGSTEVSPAIAVEARLQQLAQDASLGFKRLHKQLRDEGFAISQNEVRRQLAGLRSGQNTAAAATDVSESTPRTCAATDPTTESLEASAAASPSGRAEGVVVALLPLRAHVRIEGLQSEKGATLNGCEGRVVGHDLGSARVHVDLAKKNVNVTTADGFTMFTGKPTLAASVKSFKASNIRVLSTPADPLPMPCGPWPSVSELHRKDSVLEALVLGQSTDSAFLSHTMPPWLRKDLLNQKLSAVVELVLAVSQACHDSQASNSSAGVSGAPLDLSHLLPLADQAVSESSDGVSQTEHVAALFFRADLWRRMGDWHASAKDYRAAYVASAGRQPWILKQAGWTTASATDGVSQVVVAQNYEDAQLLYEILLHFIDQSQDADPPKELKAAKVFCLWELAQVLVWRMGQDLMRSMQAGAAPVPQLGIRQQICALRDRALEAERLLASGGVMNCLARDAVMRITSCPGWPQPAPAKYREPPKTHQACKEQRQSKQRDTECEHGVEQPATTSNEQVVAPKAGNLDLFSSWLETAGTEETSSFLQRQAAYMQMEEQEVSRMKQDEQSSKTLDVVGQLFQRCEEQAQLAADFERRAQIRRKALETKAEALAEREAAFRRREGELADQKARVAQEAEALKGNTAALEELYRREKLRQAEDFAAEKARLRKEHLAEIAKLQEQFFEATRQGEQEMQTAIDAQRESERALQEVVGARHAEAERWQREHREKEEQNAFERESLAAQAAQLAEMQAELNRKSQRLEDRNKQIQRERRAQEQLLAEGALSQELIGKQRPGPRCVLLREIRFSQDSISATFRDGRCVKRTTEDLKVGRVLPADLGDIRVVEVFELVWTLDNRRVRCMKDAFARDRQKTINVKVETLADAKILDEFRRKFTTGKQIFVR
eukprot:TRINITY_DN4781_c0_g2_i1.p1 TRINITY_DN4781_c0_g2~~TRINITY_DN4781_c0_g2_i1.p1  ORF type:complete len:1099 (+),score=169.66 TRINITY_DN4781_c0_g2_i1:31-3297(+)